MRKNVNLFCLLITNWYWRVPSTFMHNTHVPHCIAISSLYYVPAARCLYTVLNKRTGTDFAVLIAFFASISSIFVHEQSETSRQCSSILSIFGFSSLCVYGISFCCVQFFSLVKLRAERYHKRTRWNFYIVVFGNDSYVKMCRESEN